MPAESPSSAALQTAADAPRSLAIVICGAGGYRFGFEAQGVSQAGSICKDANVPTLESCLGLSGTTQQRRHILEFNRPQGSWKLNVAVPLEFCTLFANQIHPLPSLLARHPPVPGLCAFALWRDEDDFLPLLDSRQLAKICTLDVATKGLSCC